MSSFASRWKQLPIAASSVVVCGVLVFGAMYIVSYRQRESYLTSRNFRLLEVLAKQTNSAIDGHRHTRAVKLHRAELPTATQLELSDGQARLTLVFGNGKSKKDVDTERIDRVLRPVFEMKVSQGAFDTLALAEPGGKLVFAAGRREWEMSTMTLSALLPQAKVPTLASANEPETAAKSSGLTKSTARANSPEPAFETITVLDASIAGVPYKMFIQPCCELVTQPSGLAGAVVVGLVPSSALRDEAMAISPTLVVITILLIVLVALAWPFLNVALQGPRKRITRLDAFQLGFSGTVGLAIATILAITSMQCVRLERDLGRQLHDLAKDFDDTLSEEIAESARTLDALEKWLLACPRGAGPVGYAVEKDCAASSFEKVDVAQFTNYDFAALIDSQGRQKRKASPESRTPALVNVNDRLYFQTALAHANDPATQETLRKKDPISCLGSPCVLDSVIAYVKGKPSAVLARPSRDPLLPVAALTVPMRSVIDPVLPPGFEFAVIDRTGRVVFHSDVQRNGFEDLFLETDRNPQLRALVATGVDGPVSMVYWGRPYIAHVRHAQAYGWSIVTMFNRRDLRALMLEWTMVSILLLGVYAVLWAAALGLAVTTGASWLWPDRFRRRRYVLLSLLYLLLLVGFHRLAAYLSFDRSAVAIAGFLLPAVACVAGVLMLRHQPPARAGTAPLEYRRGYCVPGALFLIIVGILPGAAFVARSYDVHVEAYVKHRQLELVQKLMAPAAIADGAEVSSNGRGKTHGNPTPLKRWYSEFLDKTSVCHDPGPRDLAPWTAAGAACPARKAAASLPTCPAATKATSGVDEAAATGRSQGRDPFGPLEALLPYFSEMSVKIRELVHAKADDKSWTSERNQRTTILRVPQPAATPPGVVEASTSLPPLLTVEGVGTLLVPMAIVLFAMAYGIAFFIARYVFLGQVSAKDWELGRLAIPEGRPVILLCDPAAMMPRIHGAAHLALEPLLGADDPRAALSQALERLTGDRYSGEPILVTDMDSGESALEGVAVKAKLLASLSRRCAVLALSRRSFAELAAALEAEHPRSQAVRTLSRAMADLEKARAIVLDWRLHPGAAAGPVVIAADSGMRGWLRGLWARALGQPAGSQTPGSRARRGREPRREPLVHAEERAHPGLHAICDSVRRLDAYLENRMSHTEIVEEIEERAAELYGKVWKQCTDDEKLELRHIAQFGFANPGNGRAVRQLIAKRLVSKDPNLRLMNRTFRRFVLASHGPAHRPLLDVARIESTLAPSGLDRFRGLFALAAAVVAAFLYFTQRDAYNATIGAVVAVATQLPHILKAATMMVQKDTAVPPGQRNA